MRRGDKNKRQIKYIKTSELKIMRDNLLLLNNSIYGLNKKYV